MKKHLSIYDEFLMKLYEFFNELIMNLWLIFWWIYDAFLMSLLWINDELMMNFWWIYDIISTDLIINSLDKFIINFILIGNEFMMRL